MSDEFVCLTCWEGDRRSGNGKNSTTRYSACQFQGPLEHIVLCCSYSDCPPRPNPKCRTISCRMSVSVHSVCWQFLPSRDPQSTPTTPNSHARSKGVQVSAMHPLHIWMQPPAICKISNKNRLINLLQTCDTLPQPRVAFSEQLWLQTAHLKKKNVRICEMFCAMWYGALKN
jgi:hypothetical protein